MISRLFGSDSEEEEEEEEKPVKIKSPPRKKVKPLKSRPKSNSPVKRESHDSGDEYDSGEEVVRTREDDAFIDGDDDLADVLGEYEQEDQRFDDERPMDELKTSRKEEEEDFFDQTIKSMKSGRRGRSKTNLSIQEQEQMVQEVLYRMDKAHADDLVSMSEKRPALERIKYVDQAIRMLQKQLLQPTFLDFAVLGIIKKWIQPLEDGTLPNLGVRTKLLQLIGRLPIMKDHLKRDGFGKVIMTLWKHPQEVRKDKSL